jgi:hypothetical protein
LGKKAVSIFGVLLSQQPKLDMRFAVHSALRVIGGA